MQKNMNNEMVTVLISFYRVLMWFHSALQGFMGLRGGDFSICQHMQNNRTRE